MGYAIRSPFGACVSICLGTLNCHAGDIISLTLPGQTMIILNTPQMAIELLDKKGAIYSDRPTLPVAGRIMGWDQTLGLYHYGPVWREGRRMYSRTLGSRKNIDNLADQLEEENHRFLGRLSTEPGQLLQHVRRYEQFHRILSLVIRLSQ